jgi:hypothetical protein
LFDLFRGGGAKTGEPYMLAASINDVFAVYVHSSTIGFRTRKFPMHKAALLSDFSIFAKDKRRIQS